MEDKIAAIIKNPLLATSVYRSVSVAFTCPFVHLSGGKTVWEVFEQSLHAAIRDIEKHPRGKLFRRLIEYGPLMPEAPETQVSDGERFLSDPECGSCVEFIFSHMVNRFKGELAELLALEPCILLLKQLQQQGRLPIDIQLYWGEMIQERIRRGKVSNPIWGRFTKGADGLVVGLTTQTGKMRPLQVIHGVIEIKSMNCSRRRVEKQLNRHVLRLSGGVKLGNETYSTHDLHLNPSRLTQVMVIPSTWKLSRKWKSSKHQKGTTYMTFELSQPPNDNQVEQLTSKLWKIKLAWSQEALEEAAYNMTFWYMAQVGKYVYAKKSLPKNWESMTPEEAGYNSIKMMLYFILLRRLSRRQTRLAIKLYNIYCFGYPLGVDSKEMLWPEDVQ